MSKDYNLEALEKQKEDIQLKIKRLEAQLVIIDTAISRAENHEVNRSKVKNQRKNNNED